MGTIGKLVALFMVVTSIVAQTITTAPKVTKVRLEQLE
jgi:flagellar biosynthesis protein FliQ